MKKILITGPESSGKSVLAESLAKLYAQVWVKEFAREYLVNKINYQEKDLLEMAKGQKKSEKRIWDEGHEYVFSDTGIEVIQIWSEVKYGRVDTEICKLENMASYDLILVCKPNIPWQYDVLREHENNRENLFEKYLDFLTDRKLEFKIIDADMSNRLEQANAWVSKL